jgi:hypothetical protein
MKKITHRTFGEVSVGTKRTTTGGNEVYDAMDKKGRARVLLIDARHWESA